VSPPEPYCQSTFAQFASAVTNPAASGAAASKSSKTSFISSVPGGPDQTKAIDPPVSIMTPAGTPLNPYAEEISEFWSKPHSTLPEGNRPSATRVAPSRLESTAGATTTIRSWYSPANSAKAGNSRRQTSHHSAQKTTRTGLVCSERAKVPSVANSRVKSAAGVPIWSEPQEAENRATSIIPTATNQRLRHSTKDTLGTGEVLWRSHLGIAPDSFETKAEYQTKILYGEASPDSTPTDGASDRGPSLEHRFLTEWKNPPFGSGPVHRQTETYLLSAMTCSSTPSAPPESMDRAAKAAPSS